MKLANYAHINTLAAEDLISATNSHKLHADEYFHVVWSQWRAIEQGAQECGWDIFKAAKRNSVRAAIAYLRINLLRILPPLLAMARNGSAEAAVVEYKNETYGASWKRRGGVGAFMMLARKMDRIETISKGDSAKLRQAMAEDTGGILDDIDDLRRYLLLVQSETTAEDGDATQAYVQQC